MVIFVTFTPCIVSICGSLLRGQSVRFLTLPSDCFHSSNYYWKVTDHVEWSTIYVASFSLFYIVEILFLFCFFGNILTTNLLLVAESAYDSQWYAYPTKVQKYLAFMIRSAQKPFWIDAFGIMPCTLENFAVVRIFKIHNYWSLHSMFHDNLISGDEIGNFIFYGDAKLFLNVRWINRNEKPSGIKCCLQLQHETHAA